MSRPSLFIALLVPMVIAGPVFGSDGHCIPIEAANWKEGAVKAVVKTVLARQGNDRVWIVVCKWEYAGGFERDDGTVGYPSLGHIRG
jgi:hypothetical protein